MSNIEDDVKVLENYLKELDNLFSRTNINNTKERNAIRNILSEREQLLKEKKDDKQDIKDFQNALNEENLRCANYAIENNELKKRIKELEAKLEFKKYGDLDEIEFEEYMSHFIPKQKVKDKIEELENAKRETTRENWHYIYSIQLKILQELLEEGE